MKKKLISVLLLMSCILVITGCGKEKDEICYTKARLYDSDFYVGTNDIGFNSIEEAAEADAHIFMECNWSELLKEVNSKNWELLYETYKDELSKCGINGVDDLKKCIQDNPEIMNSAAVDDDYYELADLSTGRLDISKVELTKSIDDYEWYCRVWLYFDMKRGVEYDEEIFEEGIYDYQFSYVKVDNKYYPVEGYEFVERAIWEITHR